MLSGLSIASGKILLGVLACGAVVVSGAGMAAYAHVSTEAEQVVSSTTGTPEGDEVALDAEALDVDAEVVGADVSASETPVGPDATGPAAFGLCNAYSHGGLNVLSTAYKSLQSAVDGDSDIESMCSAVPHPGSREARDGDDTEADSTEGDSAESEDSESEDLDGTEADVDGADDTAKTHGKSGETHGQGAKTGRGAKAGR